MMPRRTSGSPPVRRSGYAFSNERATQAVEFLEAEQVGLRQERHVFRHAVHTAEIAAVGHRDAQISDNATKQIDQRARPGAGAIEIKCGCTVGRYHNPSPHGGRPRVCVFADCIDR